MSDLNIVLPSKPRVVSEDNTNGVFEIDGLYPGYGHTLGNSLRRIILSSIEGAAVTSIKIKGVSHEFSTIDGVKEDVINIILNLKKLRLQVNTSESQIVNLKVRGPKQVTAADLSIPGQIEVMNPEQYICEITTKNTELDIEMRVEKGLGYVSKEMHQKDKVEIGSIALDAIFTPIKRVNYEVENMRVGNRTDFNRLRVTIESDGSISPKNALEKSIEIMINQLRAIVGFKEESTYESSPVSDESGKTENKTEQKEDLDDVLKTRVESLNLSQRTINALTTGNIRTLGGLARKKEKDLGDIEGLGPKGVQEIKDVLREYDIELK